MCCSFKFFYKANFYKIHFYNPFKLKENLNKET